MSKEKEQARYFIEEVPVFCAYDEVVSIDNIKPNPKNPNMYPDEQIRLLADVILKTGVRAPITVSKLSGLIVKGHGRLEAAKVAGLKEFPVEYQVFKDNEEEMSALLADNKIAELAEIDNEKLKEIFNDFEFEDLSITGFSEEELKELTEIFEETELLGDPDEEQRKDLSDSIKDVCQVIIECKNEAEQESLYNEFVNRGLTCRVLTL